MKTKNMIWAALSMTAALVMTACTNDDNMVETPAAPQDEVKTIPYTVTVNDGAATTRATVDSDNKTLRFATGDKLYITGTNVKGVLEITSGVGETTGATFEGDLNYTGDAPASDLSLTATLVSAQQTVGTEVSVDAAGAVTVNYPTAAYCDDVATAVQKYSRLTGTSTYGAKSFDLTQQTAFLNFVISFTDGTTAGTALSTVVKNGATTLCTANRTTTTESEKVVPKFVLPVASGTVLSGATVTMGDKYALSFGASQTLTAKVYNVKRTQYQYPPLSAATTSDKGKLICTDGHIHAYNADAGCTKSRVAKIIYVGSSTGDATYTHGLALALADESTSSMAWDAANTACSGKNTSAAVASASWMLPSKAQWSNMISAAGSYTDLRDGFSSVGGSNLESRYYWSSTEDEVNTARAWMFYFSNGSWYEDPKTRNNRSLVRACLAF